MPLSRFPSAPRGLSLFLRACLVLWLISASAPPGQAVELTRSDEDRATVAAPRAITRLVLGQGRSRRSDGPRDGDFLVTADAGQDVFLKFEPRDGDESKEWEAHFSAPGDALLVPGFYSDTEEWVNAEKASFSLSHGGSSETGDGASFAIHQLDYSPEGSVSAFWATFLTSWGERGEVRFNAARRAPVPNTAPIVWVGEDLALRNLESATLEAEVADDGLTMGRPVRVRWSKVSGPGTAEFQNARHAHTKATFSQPGTYVLRLTATDGRLEGSDELTITQAAERTSLSLRTNTGSRYYTPRDGTFEVDRWSGNRLSITFRTPSQVQPGDPEELSIWIIIEPPEGGRLTRGYYSFSEGTPERPEQARFSVAGPDLGGGGGGGAFFVHEATYDAAGALRSFWATFAERDHGAGVTGEIRIHVAEGEAVGPNQPPFVDAGLARSGWRELKLDGVVVDDGQPFSGARLRTWWSVVEGPGLVTFLQANEPTTTAIFSQPGTYRLRLTADDGEVSMARDLTLTVAPPPFEDAPFASGGYAGLGVASSGGGLRAVFQLNVTASRSFSASVRIDGQQHAFTGVFTGDNGGWSGTIERVGAPSLAITLSRTALGQIAGSISDGTTSVPLLLQPTAEVGSDDEVSGEYTFALLASADSAETGAPHGHGFGLMKVSPSGGVRWLTVLPDGKVLTGAGGLNVLNQFAMTGGSTRRGSLLSGLIACRVRAVPMADVHGPNVGYECGGRVLWTKLPSGANPGFTTELTMAGSSYRRFGYDFPAMPAGQGNAQLTLDRAGWRSPLSADLHIRGQARAAKMTLLPGDHGISRVVFDPGVALFAGHFRDPETSQPGRFIGVILQSTGVGYGFHRGPDGDTGIVELRPAP